MAAPTAGARALASALYGGTMRASVISAGATQALESSGVMASITAASVDTLAGVADGLLDLYANAGARGTAARMYSEFCTLHGERALPASRRLVAAWLVSRAVRINTAGPRQGQVLKSSGIPTSLGALRVALTSGAGADWAISGEEYAQLRELCTQLQRALPSTLDSGTGLSMTAMWALHERLLAAGTAQSRRLRAWLALAVGLAMRGNEMSGLRWPELVADASLGLAALPTASKTSFLVLSASGTARAAPHLSAELGIFCALGALTEHAPDAVAALLRGGPGAPAGPVFIGDDGAAWPCAAAEAELRGHLAALGLADKVGDHIGRDTFIALMQGELGMKKEDREAAGGWAPSGTQARSYPLPREGLLLDSARAVAALVGGPACCGAVVPRHGAATRAADRHG